MLVVLLELISMFLVSDSFGIVQLSKYSNRIVSSINTARNRGTHVHRIARIDDIPNQQAFDTITSAAEKSPIVIDFQKSNCSPCKRVAPLFNAMAKKYENSVRFYKVDADSSKEALLVLKANNIKAVPTFQLWLNGQQIEVIQGAKLTDLEEAIIDALEASKKALSA